MSNYPSPYQPNAYQPTTPYGVQQQPPGDPGQLKVLGIIFIVMSVIGFLSMGAMAVGNIVAAANGSVEIPQDMDPAEKSGFYFGYYGVIVATALSPLVQPFVLWSGINMLRQKGRRMAFAGAIVASIPGITPCCLLGMPFGIWALIALSQPAAKIAFERNGG